LRAAKKCQHYGLWTGAAAATRAHRHTHGCHNSKRHIDGASRYTGDRPAPRSKQRAVRRGSDPINNSGTLPRRGGMTSKSNLRRHTGALPTGQRHTARHQAVLNATRCLCPAVRLKGSRPVYSASLYVANCLDQTDSIPAPRHSYCTTPKRTDVTRSRHTAPTRGTANSGGRCGIAKYSLGPWALAIPEKVCGQMFCSCCCYCIRF